MKKRNYRINNINNDESMNNLIHCLNNISKITHIKIGKDTIDFTAVDIESFKEEISAIDDAVEITELIGGKEVAYTYRPELKERFYYIKDESSDKDVEKFVEDIRKIKKYSKITYSKTNRLLRLSTKEKDPLVSLKKEIKIRDYAVWLEEHDKPLMTPEEFREKYIKKYLWIGLFILFMALAMVTDRNHNVVTVVLYMLCVGVMSINIIRNAVNAIKTYSSLNEKLLHEDVIFLLALIFAVIGGHYIEAMVASALYQTGALVKNALVAHSMHKLDKEIDHVSTGCLLADDQEQEISLHEFNENDLMVVLPDTTIALSGVVVEGESKISTYMNDSDYSYKEVKSGDTVQSGDVNISERLVIRVNETYSDSNMNNIFTVAHDAPLTEARFLKHANTLLNAFTVAMVLCALGIGIIGSYNDSYNMQIYTHLASLVLILSSVFSSKQSIALITLSALVKAFNEGIVTSSVTEFDEVNNCRSVVYECFYTDESSETEFNMLGSIKNTKRNIIVFNDGPKVLEDERFTVYNNLSMDEKKEKIASIEDKVVYIGDSLKDVELLESAQVGVSRGGIADGKVVENSDIVLLNKSFATIYEVFRIAKRIRLTAIMSFMIALIVKLAIFVVALHNPLLWMPIVLIVEIIMIFITVNVALTPLKG